jgi:outer membrane protein assembly factor BamB
MRRLGGILVVTMLVAAGGGCSSGNGGVSATSADRTRGAVSSTTATVTVERLRSHATNGMIIGASSGQPVAAVDVDGPITAAVSDGSGGWFIAGGFSVVDGHARPNLAHVRADGSLDSRWRGPPLGPPSALPFLSVARTGPRVLVAGAFNASRLRRPGVIAIRASDGGFDAAWKAPRVCYDGDWAVRAGAGRIWVATSCGAGACLVAIRPSTGRPVDWSPTIAAIGETGCVNDIAIQGDEVFFTGGFTAVGSLPREGIAAARSSDGRVVQRFAPRGPCARDGHAIAAADKRVFVGGDGCPVAAFAASTGRPLWAWPRHGNATTTALLAIAGRVYVGGEFARLANVKARGLVALDAQTGDPVATWHPSTNALVYALAASHGRILIGSQ